MNSQQGKRSDRQSEIEIFDRVSKTYDAEFTRSALGSIYRDRVHKRFNALFKPGMLVLDIGCGTGDDAIHLARRGVSVIACDFSEGMLYQADKKIKQYGFSKDIELRHLQAEDLVRFIEELPMGFDGIYSNFGPLNMVSDLDKFIRITARLLDPGCRALHVIMNRMPVYETLYFLLHSRFTRAFERWSGKATVPIGGKYISCRFYSPREITKLFEMYFTVDRIEALGLILPPPYLSGHYRRRRNFYRPLVRFDRWLSNQLFFNSLGDHFIIEMTRERDIITSSAN
jgi:ubiquinone/menaquinone biosynthesis C-methylase UbiE